jgi:hypothetical protein
VVISVTLTACASTTPTERERAVAKLPSQAQLVAAADGTALAAFRNVIDAARPLVPGKLDCVVDAALTSEAVAVALTPQIGATVVIVTRAHVARCPALSRIGDGTFVATVGAGSIADTPAASPLGDPRWARARSYLLGDPIAIAVQEGDQRVLAVAQPRPLAGWLAIDARDIAPVERAVRAWIDRQRATSLAPFASHLLVQPRGTQLLVRVGDVTAEQLALAVGDGLRSLDTQPAAAPAGFACPTNGVVRCAGTSIVVDSLATTLKKLVAVGTEPVVAGGDIVGIRLSEDPEVLLRRGDVVLGVDGHRITSAAQLQELARYVHDRTALAIRRDGSEIILDLSE